jgi:hypothetical protein
VTTVRPGATSRVVGSLLRTKISDDGSPILYGVPDNLAVYSNNGWSFNISDAGGRGGAGAAGQPGTGGRGGGPGPVRATGRGTPDDPDVVQGRPAIEGAEDFGAPSAPGGGRGSNSIQTPMEFRPRPVLRFDQQASLLVSGLLDGGADIAGQAVVVDVPAEKGHYVLFANNPIYRGETLGSYFMVFNTILNFDSLGLGRK